MAVRLHELIAKMQSGYVYVPENIPMSWLTDHVEPRVLSRNSPMCFDGGDLNDLVGLTIIRELCRLPYETTWVELYEPETKTMYGYFMYDSPAGLTYDIFVRLASGLWRYVYRADMIDAEIRMSHEFAGADEYTNRMITHAPLFFLNALNCANTRQVRHKPRQSRQAARQRKGKQPMFSYWTLTLPEHAPAPNVRGGTPSDRNGPRVHLRRGHIRSYAPGKYCWVRPHAVGHKKLGMVHKDYAWRADESRA